MISGAAYGARRRPSGWTDGYSVLFDGVDEYAEVTSPSFQGDTAASNGRTFSCWFKLNGTATTNQIASFGGPAYGPTYHGFWTLLGRVNGANYNLRVQSRIQNGSSFAPTQLTSLTTTSLSAGTWYHLVYTTTSAQAMAAWINGVSQTMTVDSGSAIGHWFGDLGITGTRKFVVGTAYNDGTYSSNYLNGYLDEVTMWNKNISASEVAELYNSGSPVDPTGVSFAANLDSYWRMGDGDTYPTLTDSANGDDLTMVNMESGDIQTDVP